MCLRRPKRFFFASVIVRRFSNQKSEWLDQQPTALWQSAENNSGDSGFVRPTPLVLAYKPHITNITTKKNE